MLCSLLRHCLGLCGLLERQLSPTVFSLLGVCEYELVSIGAPSSVPFIHSLLHYVCCTRYSVPLPPSSDWRGSGHAVTQISFPALSPGLILPGRGHSKTQIHRQKHTGRRHIGTGTLVGQHMQPVARCGPVEVRYLSSWCTLLTKRQVSTVSGRPVSQYSQPSRQLISTIKDLLNSPESPIRYLGGLVVRDVANQNHVFSPTVAGVPLCK